MQTLGTHKNKANEIHSKTIGHTSKRTNPLALEIKDHWLREDSRMRTIAEGGWQMNRAHIVSKEASSQIHNNHHPSLCSVALNG